MSVQDVQNKTTSREFLRWVKILEEEPNEFNVLHFYLAQIAAELRDLQKMQSKKKHKPTTVEEMLITFVSSTIPTEEEDELAEQQSTMMSKQFWLGGLGMQSELEQERTRE